MSGARHALQVEFLEARIAQLESDRDYWKRRAERLIDSDLARSGKISEPTMRDATVHREPSLASQLIGALSITEIGERPKLEGT